MKSSIIRIAKLVVGWPIALLSIFYIFRYISPNLSTVFKSTLYVRYDLVLISVALFLVYFIFRTLLWQYILKFKGHSFTFRETSYLWSVSEIKRFLPGGIWAVLGRTQAFAKDDITHKAIFSSILIEVESMGAGSLLVSLFGFYFLEKMPFLKLSLPLALFTALLASVVSVFIFIFGKHLMKKFPKIARLALPSFSTKENIILLFLGVVSMLFFSLGTYFSIIALFPLPIENIFAYLGLFSFSFFIGYAAVFVPMGIGVREGTITFGLSQFIGISFAATGAIFARIVVIFAEILYFSLSALFHHYNKLSLIKKLSLPAIFVALSSTMYAIYFTVASFLRYTNFYTGRFDLGNMDQVVWNTLHGRIFEFTNPDGTQIVSRLSSHADFLLILFAPLYLLWQDPRMLLFIQTILLALGAVFVYQIAKHVLKEKPIAAALAFAYLLNPALEHSNLYDFHAVVPATTFLLIAWYFLLKKRFLPTLIFLILVGISKEEAWAVTGLIGLYAAWKTDKRILWLIFSTLSFSMLSFLMIYAIPHTRGGYHFAISYYGELGSTPAEILHTIFFSPLKTFFIATQQSKLFYFFQLFLPVGFVSIFAPFYLIFALPDLVINLLSTNTQLHQIYYQYTALITPFIFISAIFGVKNVTERFPKIHKKYLIGCIVICSVISTYFYGPLPGSQSQDVVMFTHPLQGKEVIDEFIRKIPDRYSIAATNTVGSHLSHRQKIYTIPTGLKEADLVVFLFNDEYAQPSPAAQKKMAKDLEKDPQYSVLITDGTFEVFARKNVNVQVRRIPRKKIQSPALSFLQGLFSASKM